MKNRSIRVQQLVTSAKEDPGTSSVERGNRGKQTGKEEGEREIERETMSVSRDLYTNTKA